MINNDAGTIRGISLVLNEAYGDNGTSPLDRVAATKVLQYMRSMGWMSPQEIAFLVDAAGGKITISRAGLEEKELVLRTWSDDRNYNIIFESRGQ